MLHYESSLVRLFRTIFYSLPLTLGITEEKQKVELNFFDDYTDDSVGRLTDVLWPKSFSTIYMQLLLITCSL